MILSYNVRGGGVRERIHHNISYFIIIIIFKTNARRIRDRRLTGPIYPRIIYALGSQSRQES